MDSRAKPQPTQIWVCVEQGLTGTELQAIAIAEALVARIGGEVRVCRFTLKAPWRWLAPYLWQGLRHGYKGDDLGGPAPALFLSAGRKAAAVAQAYKRGAWYLEAAGQRPQTGTRYIQLMDPRGAYQAFDWLVVPHHDPYRAAHTIVTDGAPNRISPQRLEAARTQWEDSFGPLPSPRIGVLIGGNSRAHTLTDTHLDSMMASVRAAAEASGGSLLLTLSRRSGSNAPEIAAKALAGGPPHTIWAGEGPNPYEGILAWADVLLVSEDSVNMVSEAGSTGKPVYILPLEGGSDRFNRFHSHMQALGVTRPFRGQIESWVYPPLQDAAKVADELTHWLKDHTS